MSWIVYCLMYPGVHRHAMSYVNYHNPCFMKQIFFDSVALSWNEQYLMGPFFEYPECTATVATQCPKKKRNPHKLIMCALCIIRNYDSMKANK